MRLLRTALRALGGHDLSDDSDGSLCLEHDRSSHANPPSAIHLSIRTEAALTLSGDSNVGAPLLLMGHFILHFKRSVAHSSSPSLQLQCCSQQLSFVHSPPWPLLTPGLNPDVLQDLLTPIAPFVAVESATVDRMRMKARDGVDDNDHDNTLIMTMRISDGVPLMLGMMIKMKIMKSIIMI